MPAVATGCRTIANDRECTLGLRTLCHPTSVFHIPPSWRRHHLTGSSSIWLQSRSRSNAGGASAVHAVSEAAVAATTLAAIVAVVTATVVMSSRTDAKKESAPEDPSSSQGFGPEEAGQSFKELEELEAILPADLQEALETFDGDFRGPWSALDLEADDQLLPDEIRRAYRKAVRSEHPDTSKFPDADERFERVRQAYAILKDDGSRALLLEAIAQDAGSFDELSSRQTLPDESRSGTSSMRGLLVGVGVAGLVSFAAFVARLSGSSEMKPRSAKKNKAPVIVNSETQAEATAKTAQP